MGSRRAFERRVDDRRDIVVAVVSMLRALPTRGNTAQLSSRPPARMIDECTHCYVVKMLSPVGGQAVNGLIARAVEHNGEGTPNRRRPVPGTDVEHLPIAS